MFQFFHHCYLKGLKKIVLGDLILIWRCFMVWNRNYYAIALPAIMLLGTTSMWTSPGHKVT